MPPSQRTFFKCLGCLCFLSITLYLLFDQRTRGDPLLPDRGWLPLTISRAFAASPISTLEIRVSDLATQEGGLESPILQVKQLLASRGGAVLVTGCMGRIGFGLIRQLLRPETDSRKDSPKVMLDTRVVCVDIFPWSLVVEGSRLDTLFATTVGQGGPTTLLQHFLSTSDGPEVTVANFKYFQGDIRNKALLDRIFNLDGDWKISGVVHLASYSEVRY